MRDCVLLYNTKKTVKLFILTQKLLDNCKTFNRRFTRRFNHEIFIQFCRVSGSHVTSYYYCVYF